MGEDQLRRVVRDLAEQGVPGDVDLWPGVRARLRAQRVSASTGERGWGLRFPRLRLALPSGRTPGRLGAALASLVLVVVLGGAGYSVLNALDRASNMYLGEQAVTVRNLGKEVDESVEIGGFLVAFKWVYADANQVIVGYEVEPPEGRELNSYSLHDTKLFTEQGRELPQTGGVGGYGDTSVTGNITAFDASGIEGSPKVVKVRLRVSGMVLVEQVENAEDADSPVQAGRDGDTTTVVAEDCGGGTSPIRCVTISSKPFELEFAVPYEPGRVAETNQTVESGGTKATLEKVVVTPTETRVYVRGIQSTDTTADLLIDGRRQGDNVRSGVSETEDGRVVYWYAAPLFEKSGEWTLTIRTREPHPLLDEMLEQRGMERTKGGLWTFRFTVP